MFWSVVADLTLAAVVKNDDAGANKFRAPSSYPTNLDVHGDSSKAKPIVQRFGNPALPLGDIANAYTPMAIRHGAIVAPIGELADELKCFARLDVLIGITAPVDPVGRFVL